MSQILWFFFSKRKNMEMMNDAGVVQHFCFSSGVEEVNKGLSGDLKLRYLRGFGVGLGEGTNSILWCVITVTALRFLSLFVSLLWCYVLAL